MNTPSNEARMSMDLKRFAIAGVTIILTTGLAVLAIALAQRDSRDSESMLNDEVPAYANQTPEPLQFSLGAESLATEDPSPVPKNMLRTISSTSFPRGGTNEEEPVVLQSELEEPPRFPMPELVVASPKSIPQDIPAASEPSEVVLAADQQTAGTSNGPAVAPVPRLLTAPSPASGPASTTNPSFPTSSATNSNSFGGNGFAAPPAALLPPSSSPPSFPNVAPKPVASMSNGPNAGDIPSFNASLPVLPNNPSRAPAINSLPAPNNPPVGNTPGFNPSPSPLASSLPPSTSSVPPRFPAAAPNNFSNPAYSNTPNSGSPSVQPLTSTNATPRELPRSLPPAPVVESRPNLGTNKVLASLASAAPGSRQMDGAQNPSMQIQKKAPEEVQVGQIATFALTVRNVGNATAYEVSVVDSVPRGTKLSKTNPPAEQRSDGTLVWALGEMAAGTEQVLTIELIPETEGEIGSVASVNFAAQASVRTVSTQPKLVVKQVAEKKILLGKSLGIRVTVTNEGTGVARGVSLEEDVPRGLRHPLGSSLGVPLGDLAPGQSKSTDLELIAIEPGFTQNIMRAVSSNTSESNSTIDLEVVAPKLRLEVAGPKLRYLERQATYQVSVTNQGTSTAFDVEMTAQLPRGMQYNSSGNHGEYLSDKHAVKWSLEELPVGATATTEMTLLPVEEGAFAIRMQSQAVGIECEPLEKQVQIEGQSELAFSIDDDNDPIEVDGQTTYLVRLTNTGTRSDEDVQLMVELPSGARVLDVRAPVGYKETQQGLVFEPISQMRAKDLHQFRFSIQLPREGIQIVRAHVKSRLRPNPVIKEESTEVYRDR